MLIISISILTISIVVAGADNAIFANLLNIPLNEDSCEPDCKSVIFCMGKGNNGGPGNILHDVQTSDIYQDGTIFVRKKLKYPEIAILTQYEIVKQKSLTVNASRKTELLKEFVDENFEDDDLPYGNLTDFKKNPSILDKVDPYFQPWLSRLNDYWKNLTKLTPLPLRYDTGEGRKHSYIYVPNKFVVAGGRFQEMYYWDSYWIIKGLLACEMYDTARGIIENIIYLVEKFGYMPNGNRVYYLRRSQLPMLIQMADHYYQVTKNKTFIKANLKIFEKEFFWWFNNRRMEVEKDGRIYHLFHYNSTSCFPRPESYKEDYVLLTKCRNIDEAKQIFTGIRSAAETGWDFSSRHMRDPVRATQERNGLIDMAPQDYAYVDLNSIIYSNVKLLAEWKRKFESDQQQAKSYENFAEKMLDSIENVLWNEEEGIWLDYDAVNKKHRNFFFLSNFLPLWSKTYYKTPEKVNRTIKYLQRNQMINTDLSCRYYGLPTSDIKESKQQWDFPNVWPPLQSFVIRGLQESNNLNAQKIALNLAKAFVETAYAGFQNNDTMFEKYDAIDIGKPGGNGEYKTQVGFGWTNGFIFELFTMWNNLTISN